MVLILLIKVMDMHVVPLSITVGEFGIIVHVFVDVFICLVCTRNGGWPACGDGGNPICKPCLHCRWCDPCGALLPRFAHILIEYR